MKEVSIRDITQACKNNTGVFGELQALIQLLKLNRFAKVEWIGGNRFHKKHCDILCDNLKIEVKSCNRDKPWPSRIRSKDRTFDSGFDRVNPKNFDYVVCVSFDNGLNDTKFFIFNKEEAKKFDNSTWKSAKGTKVIEIREYNSAELNKIIEDSKNAWNKIK